jgi:hypothetical protein
VSDERQTEAEGEAPATRHEQEEGARYPGHEDPEALRDRAGLGGHEGREPESAPELDSAE